MRTLPWRPAAAALLLLIAAGAATAADFTDPDWPCVQRRVPALAIGQMWSGPIPPEDWRPDAELREAARRLSARRVPVADVAAAAAARVDGVAGPERAERLAEMFAAILERINAERDEIITGIGRYAHRQSALSQEIENKQNELAGVEVASNDVNEMGRVEELRETLAWEERIFKERAQSLIYVCETPVLLEQRAFAVARALAGLI